MRTALLTILILIMTTNVFSQYLDVDPLKRMDIDSLKIIKSQFDSVYGLQIIPDNALHGEFDLLVTDDDKDSIKKINENKIEISWSSNYIDGRYILTITPKQIYLKSSHNNPNPNYLYWLTSITDQHYELIKSHLELQGSNIISNFRTENSTCLTYFYDKARLEKNNGNNWDNRRYDNFSELMMTISNPLSKNGEKIFIPSKSEFNKIKMLRIVIDIYELQDQTKLIRIE
jgi:hypothetical protein